MNAIPPRPPLTEADLDRAFSSASDGILPSSGFAASVMAAVHEETSAPAPIPFPWKRALPGLIAAAVAIGILLAVIPATVQSAFTSAGQQSILSLPVHHTAPLLGEHGNEAIWISASLAICLACLLFCHRLIARR